MFTFQKLNIDNNDDSDNKYWSCNKVLCWLNNNHDDKISYSKTKGCQDSAKRPQWTTVVILSYGTSYVWTGISMQSGDMVIRL